MCSKNDLEEHLFTFLKSVRENHYLLDDSDQAWINESDIREALPFPNLTRISGKLFLSQILPVEESINGKIYKNIYRKIINDIII